MRNLVQQSRRHRAVKHEVTIKELNFLDRLPPLDRRWLWAWRRLWKVVILVECLLRGGIDVLRIRAIGIRVLEHRLAVWIILPVMSFSMRRGVVRLVEVCIVMFLRVEGIVYWLRRVLLVICLVVSVACRNVLNGV